MIGIFYVQVNELTMDLPNNARWFALAFLGSLACLWYSQKTRDSSFVTTSAPPTTALAANPPAFNFDERGHYESSTPKRLRPLDIAQFGPAPNHEMAPSDSTTTEAPGSTSGFSETTLSSPNPSPRSARSSSPPQPSNSMFVSTRRSVDESPEYRNQELPSLNQKSRDQGRVGNYSSNAPRPEILPEMSAQLNSQIEYGASLARKGAYFSAQKQFMNVLYHVAQHRDLSAANTFSTEALALAWMALEEADDFLVLDAQQDLYNDAAAIIDRHETRIFDRHQTRDISKMAAAQAYYTFAREHLQLALGSNPFASKALSSLGKLYSLPATHQSPSEAGNQTGKAIICHYSALDCDSANYVAANELGVLLARNGRLRDARDVLTHSVQQLPSAAAWQNLAKVNQDLGDTEAVRSAQNQLAVLDNQPAMPGVNRSIHWVEPVQFTEMFPAENGLYGPQTPNVQPAGMRVAEEPETNTTGIKGFGQKLKSWF